MSGSILRTPRLMIVGNALGTGVSISPVSLTITEQTITVTQDRIVGISPQSLELSSKRIVVRDGLEEPPRIVYILMEIRTNYVQEESRTLLVAEEDRTTKVLQP